MYNNEEWRTVEGFDRYQVSSWGRIKGFSGRILNCRKDAKTGRRKIALCQNGEQRQFVVSDLIGAAFLGAKSPFNQIIKCRHR